MKYSDINEERYLRFNVPQKVFFTISLQIQSQTRTSKTLITAFAMLDKPSPRDPRGMFSGTIMVSIIQNPSNMKNHTNRRIKTKSRILRIMAYTSRNIVRMARTPEITDRTRKS